MKSTDCTDGVKLPEVKPGEHPGEFYQVYEYSGGVENQTPGWKPLVEEPKAVCDLRELGPSMTPRAATDRFAALLDSIQCARYEAGNIALFEFTEVIVSPGQYLTLVSEAPVGSGFALSFDLLKQQLTLFGVAVKRRFD